MLKHLITALIFQNALSVKYHISVLINESKIIEGVDVFGLGKQTGKKMSFNDSALYLPRISKPVLFMLGRQLIKLKLNSSLDPRTIDFQGETASNSYFMDNRLPIYRISAIGEDEMFESQEITSQDSKYKEKFYRITVLSEKEKASNKKKVVPTVDPVTPFMVIMYERGEVKICYENLYYRLRTEKRQLEKYKKTVESGMIDVRDNNAWKEKHKKKERAGDQIHAQGRYIDFEKENNLDDVIKYLKKFGRDAISRCSLASKVATEVIRV